MDPADWPGLFSSAEDTDSDILYYSVGTNGDAAPDPLSPGWIGLTSLSFETDADILYYSIATGGDTAPDPLSPGWLGLTSFSPDTDADILYYSMATGGDPAPEITSLVAAGLASQAVLSRPDITENYVLSADGVESASTLSVPAIVDVTSRLTAQSLEIQASLTSPSLVQIHDLSAVGMSASSAISVAFVGQSHTLSGVGLETQVQVTSPEVEDVTPTVSLAARGLVALGDITRPVIGQLHIMQGASLASLSQVSTPGRAPVRAASRAGPKPTFRNTTIRALTRSVDQGRKDVYPVYCFSGRTFTKRDK